MDRQMEGKPKVPSGVNTGRGLIRVNRRWEGNLTDKFTLSKSKYLKNIVPWQLFLLFRCFNPLPHRSAFSFILSSEINAYLKQIKKVFSQSETIYFSAYWLISLFWITSDFFHSLNAAHFENLNAYNFLICEQKHQVWIVIFLVRTWGTFWYQNNSDLLKFFDFAFSAPPASVSEAMHVTYVT